MLRAITVKNFYQFLAIQSAFLSVAQARTCYLTNGKEADSTFQPCFPDQSESVCCSIAKSNDTPNDICLSGGVCYIQDPYYRGLLRQGACTDSTWESSQCPSFNTTASNITFYMIPCPLKGRGYWCASAGSDCCDNAARLDMGEMVNVSVTALSGSVSSYSSVTSSVTSSGTSSTSSSTHSAESSASTTCTSNCDSKKGTDIAAGVGAALGACLLVALITIFMQRRSYNKNMQNKDTMINELGSAGTSPQGETRKMNFKPVELGQNAWISEADSNRLFHEVEGNPS